MKICECCGKEHDGSYASGRFCSRKCSNKYAAEKRKYEKNEKISQTLLNKTKEEKIETIKKRFETINKKFNKNLVYKEPCCPVCGQKECPDPYVCNFFRFFHKNNYKKVIDITKFGTISIIDEFYKFKNTIHELYEIQKLSCSEIQKIIGVPCFETVYRIIDKLGIQKRNGFESNLIRIEKYGLPKSYTIYHCGYHTSWEGKTFWYRSSYELDYAKILDENHISYEVESIRLPYWKSVENRKAIMVSDFYLPKTNTIVEVKSGYTYIKQDWIDRLSVLIPLGYTCKLLLDHKMYNSDNIPDEQDKHITTISM